MPTLEQLEQDYIRVAMRVSGITTKVLAIGCAWVLKKLNDREPTGIVSMRKLMKKGDRLATAEVNNPDFKTLATLMKRYNIGVSLIRHEGTNDYTVFFKAKNDAQLETAINEYLRKTIKREDPAKQGEEPWQYVHVKTPEELPPGKDAAQYMGGRLNPPPAPEHVPIPIGPSPVTPAASLPLTADTNIKPPEVYLLSPPRRSIQVELNKAKTTAQAMQTEREIQHTTKDKFRPKEHTR